MRRLRSRAGRREAGAFLAEGPQAVREAVAAPGTVRTLFVTAEGRARWPEMVAGAESGGARIVDVTDEVLDAIAETDAPQGIAAECALTSAVLGDALQPGRQAIALEAIADPGNLGTIIRTADAAAAGGVVLTPGSVDPFNGKVVRSTAGSIFHLPVAEAAGLAELRQATRDSGHLLAVVTGDGEADLATWQPHAPVCWLLGNEAHGVSDEARAIADVTVRIPMAGRAESLNVATAAAICLFSDLIARHGRLSPS